MTTVVRAGAALAALLFASPAFAQASLQWAIRYDELTTLRGSARHVLVAPDASVTIVGDYDGKLLVARFSPDGNLEWSNEIADRRCGGTSREDGVALDQAGNVFVVDVAGYVMKFAPDGALLWEAAVPTDAGLPANLTLAVVDSSGSVYAVGTTPGAADLDGIAVKYGPDGTFGWAAPWTGEGSDHPSAAILDGSGDLRVASSSAETLELLGFTAADGAPFLRVPHADLGRPADLRIDAAGDLYVAGGYFTGGMYLARFDSTGVRTWHVTDPFGGPATLRLDALGNVYVGGNANTDGTFPNYMLRKYSPEGVLTWERLYGAYGDSWVYAMVLAGDSPIVTGEFGYCYGMIRTMQHNPDGSLAWDVSYRGTYGSCGSVQYGYAIALDGAWNVYVAGETLNQSEPGVYPSKPTLLKYRVAPDADGDRSYVGFGDCDDTNPAINPSAAEIPYNGVDENCSGPADDDDVDRDGYLVASDCDDRDPRSYPGALEYNYDGVDQDCDGLDGFIAGATPETVLHDPVSLGYTQCNEAAVGGNVSVFSVSERDEGVDLNGDGDTDDYTLAYYDLAANQFVSLGVDGGYASTDGAIIVFKEWWNSTLSYYRMADGSFHDTGVFGDVETFKSVSGGRIAYTDRSSDVDGDASPDPQPCVYDTATQAVTCAGVIGYGATISGTRVAFQSYTGSVAYFDLATLTVHDTLVTGWGPIVDRDLIVYAAQGALSVYDLSTGSSRATPIRSWRSFSVSNGIISLLVAEDWFWGDLTGDGDIDDYDVLVFYDVAHNRIVNTGIDGCCGPDVSNGIVAFDKYEWEVNADLNGDGDLDDCVQQYVRLNTIIVAKAEYDRVGGKLTVVATSNNGASAGLAVAGYGNMTWRASKGEWDAKVTGLLAAPPTVTVAGREGSVTVSVVVR